jgi:hypothetical protein
MHNAVRNHHLPEPLVGNRVVQCLAATQTESGSQLKREAVFPAPQTTVVVRTVEAAVVVVADYAPLAAAVALAAPVAAASAFGGCACSCFGGVSCSGGGACSCA